MEEKPDIAKEVLRRIGAGEVHMRGRAYFAANASAFLALVIAILIVSVFIFNFISFSIRFNHHDALLGFGASGLLVFLKLFPWELLALDIALVLALQYLLRWFAWGHRLPILYVLGGLFLASAVIGIGLDATHINESFLQEADRGHLPGPLDNLYEGARRHPEPGEPAHQGIITAISGSAVTVTEITGASTTYTLLLPPNDRRATTSTLYIGESVFFAGHPESDGFHAFGLHPIN